MPRILEAKVGHEDPDGRYGFIDKGTLVSFEDYEAPGQLASGRFKEVRGGSNGRKSSKVLPAIGDGDDVHERRDDGLGGQPQVHDDGGEC